MKNRVTVKIMDANYSLLTEENEEYTERVAAQVNAKMNEILNENPRASTSMAAVMTALDYCDEAGKAKEAADNLRSQIKDYLTELTSARNDRDELSREVVRLRSEVGTLKNRIGEPKIN